MTTERQHQFLWIDLETTGLVPSAGKILEWAVVLAADDAAGSLEPVDSYASCAHSPRAETLALCDDYVTNMHTVNGLIDACDAEPATLEAGESFIVDLLGGEKTKGVILAGSSVHFDLAWVRHHMPRLAKCLSYRVLDVTAIKLAERAYFDPGFSVDADRVPKHRALDDVLASLTAFREWLTAHREAAQKAAIYDRLCVQSPDLAGLVKSVDGVLESRAATVRP